MIHSRAWTRTGRASLTLIRVHLDLLLTDPAVAIEVSAKVDHLLDESPIVAQARGELEALRYAIAFGGEALATGARQVSSTPVQRGRAS